MKGERDLPEISIRETICLLIRYHTAPVNALRREDPALFLRKIAANGKLAPDFVIAELPEKAELPEAAEAQRVEWRTVEAKELICRLLKQASLSP